MRNFITLDLKSALPMNITIFKYSHKHSGHFGLVRIINFFQTICMAGSHLTFFVDFVPIHFSFSVTKRCETDLFILHKQHLCMCSIQLFVSFNYLFLDIIHSYSFTKLSRTTETLYIYIYIYIYNGIYIYIYT